MFPFTGSIQKKALRFLDTLGPLSIHIIQDIWSFSMSDGRDYFQFALSNENPKARTICFYIAKPTKQNMYGAQYTQRMKTLLQF